MRNNMKKIKIKYLNKYMEKIDKIEKGDWIDLRVAEDVFMYAGEFKLIRLGVAMKLPENCEALIIPRSSTFKKYGILQANSIGLIDETYCGENDEWLFPAFAVRDTVIKFGTRICQFRIFDHQPEINIIEVEHLSDINRGGFGSTGEK